MIGKLLSTVVKVATAPIAIVESVGDVMCGGDGSKRSKDHSECFIGNEIITGICNGLESIDK